MHPIPPKVRKELTKNPEMKVCIYSDGFCFGRVEWEHCFIHSNRQIQEVWAILGVCTYHHRGKGLNKEFNQYVALKRATIKGLLPFIIQKYPKFDWLQRYWYLENKFKDK